MSWTFSIVRDPAWSTGRRAKRRHTEDTLEGNQNDTAEVHITLVPATLEILAAITRANVGDTAGPSPSGSTASPTEGSPAPARTPFTSFGYMHSMNTRDIVRRLYFWCSCTNAYTPSPDSTDLTMPRPKSSSLDFAAHLLHALVRVLEIALQEPELPSDSPPLNCFISPMVRQSNCSVLLVSFLSALLIGGTTDAKRFIISSMFLQLLLHGA